MNNKISLGIGGIVIGVIATLLLGPVMQPRSMMSRKSAGMMNNIDKHFIEQMIPHHDGAVAMAKLALTKATHSEIKTLAGAIIEAQNKEIVDMRSWYQSWFGKDVPDGGEQMMGGGMMSQGGMHMGGQEDMQTLENATDFDKAFLEQMIPHHQLAIMMANMLQFGTNRPEMLQLAKNIISSQANEIEQMQGWYTNWYK